VVAAFRKETRLVVVVHASNVSGALQPVEAVVPEALRRGILALVDGAQSTPHLPIDVNALGCDFFAFSAHKMLGPTGVGVLWARPGLLESMEPFLGGGEMIAIVKPDESTWADVPHKFEAGTPNIADVIAFGAALDYLSALGMRSVRMHEKRLSGYAIEALQSIEGLKVHGPLDPARRGGAVSFTLPGVHPHDVSTIVDSYGVAIRAGHHCASLLMRRLMVPATNRASLYMYNYEQEIDVLVDALNEAIRIFAHADSRTAVR